MGLSIELGEAVVQDVRRDLIGQISVRPTVSSNRNYLINPVMGLVESVLLSKIVASQPTLICEPK